MGCGPKPGNIVLSKINEWTGNIGIVGDKTMVEIGKTKE